SFPALVVHGPLNQSKRVPGILSFRIPGVLNQDLVEKMPGFSFSKASGPATATAEEYLSHIIYALTGDYQQCRETIRLSFGRFTTQEEIRSAAQGFVRAAKSCLHILYLEQ
ncbi:MAG: cysteine desulfurase, partial [Cyanobacteria bacterium]|nr:cysteine desulfurase [Cyanobacteriota bacterium]